MLDERDFDDVRPRRRGGFGRKLVRGFWGVVLVGVLVLAGYAAFLEPLRVEVTRHVLPGRVQKPVRIAHLTDLHSDGLGRLERRVLELIRRERPDLIVVTGDMVNSSDLQPARDFLVNLSAPLGIWLVRGNWEKSISPVAAQSLFHTIGARYLQNEGALVREDLWIAGLDDPATGAPSVDQAMAGMPENVFRLVLMHAPDFFPQVASRCDLALSGHTHGGQIVLPGIGPPWLPPGGKRYLRGWFPQDGCHLFVSRGLGTAMVPARLGARPELAIIDVRPY